MKLFVAPAILAGSLLFAGPALAQAPAAETRDVSEERDQTIRDLEATVDELRQAELEAEEVRRELLQLREELVELQHHPRQRHHELDAERVAFGQVVLVDEGETVDEVVAFGDDVHVKGVVRGDATSFGGSVIVFPTGAIHGDAVAFGGEIRVEDGGTLEGGRVSLGVPGVAVSEVTSPAAGSVGATIANDAQGLLSSIYRRLVLLLSFAGAGVLVVGLFPTRVTRIADTLEERPFRSMFVGVMATGFLMLFSLIFGIVTFGLGLPVSFVVVAALGLAWLMGFVGLCQAVGDRLPFEQKPHGRWLAFLVGTILLTCVGSLPLVGWLVVLAASAIGVGAALSSRFGGR